MAGRPIRRKIRDQGGKINQDLTRVLEHLKSMDELAEGQSEYINENLARIVLLIQGVIIVIGNFTNGL